MFCCVAFGHSVRSITELCRVCMPSEPLPSYRAVWKTDSDLSAGFFHPDLLPGVRVVAPGGLQGKIPNLSFFFGIRLMQFYYYYFLL